jgi:two-component system response regulator GlrR
MAGIHRHPQPVMLRLLEQARMVAQSDVSVLINGQSGTGKEILAQAIHNASPRSKNAFIAINCGALPEQLLNLNCLVMPAAHSPAR